MRMYVLFVETDDAFESQSPELRVQQAVAVESAKNRNGVGGWVITTDNTVNRWRFR